jgi:thiol-disulfide isomerase/thioredoxin
MKSLRRGLCFLLFVSAPAFGAGDGLIGIRYVEQPEGLVVTKVYKGSGAHDAGLELGDLIVAIDGQALETLGEGVAPPPIKGEVGSTVVLSLRSATALSLRNVQVKREKAKAKSKKTSPKVISRFAGALRNDRPSVVRKATRALVAADFGGRTALRALSPYLGRAAKRRRRAARAALDVLVAVPEPSADLQFRIGEAYYILEDHKEAATWLNAALRAWPSGVAEAMGRRGRVEEMAAMSLWSSGERQAAIDLTRRLGRYRSVRGLLGTVGMADPNPMEEWEIVLPPVADFEIDLYDGSTWRLSEHAGKPVVLVFWASWCGPCKKELPALAALHKRRGDWPVEFLAISVDTDRDAAKAKALVDTLDLPFPVGRTLALSDRFEIGGLPSMRIVGPRGSLRSATKGYSKSSISKLAKKIDDLVAEAEQGEAAQSGSTFSRVWSQGPAKLRHAQALDGVREIAATAADVSINIRGHGAVAVPIKDGHVAGGMVLEEEGGGRGHTATAWFEGPVSSGELWLRAHDAEGGGRWFVTTPSRVVAMAPSGDHLWVAMKRGILLLNSAGEHVRTIDMDVKDVAPAPGGGVWTVDGVSVQHIGPGGLLLSSEPAQGSERVAASGDWAAAGLFDLISGRFGPDASERLIGVLAGGTIVGLDGNGVAALRIDVNNATPPAIAAADLDGDGRDELLISSFGRGIATIDLEIP